MMERMDIEEIEDMESSRWAKRFEFIHTEYGGDCSGVDSGDQLDCVESEVRQALNKLQATIAEQQKEIEKLKEEVDGLHKEGLTIYAMMGASKADVSSELERLRQENQRLYSANLKMLGQRKEIDRLLMLLQKTQQRLRKPLSQIRVGDFCELMGEIDKALKGETIS